MKPCPLTKQLGNHAMTSAIQCFLTKKQRQLLIKVWRIHVLQLQTNPPNAMSGTWECFTFINQIWRPLMSFQRTCLKRSASISSARVDYALRKTALLLTLGMQLNCRREPWILKIRWLNECHFFMNLNNLNTEFKGLMGGNTLTLLLAAPIHSLIAVFYDLFVQLIDRSKYSISSTSGAPNSGSSYIWAGH